MTLAASGAHAREPCAERATACAIVEHFGTLVEHEGAWLATIGAFHAEPQAFLGDMCAISDDDLVFHRCIGAAVAAWSSPSRERYAYVRIFSGLSVENGICISHVVRHIRSL
jgi:hypothetical protein